MPFCRGLPPSQSRPVIHHTWRFSKDRRAYAASTSLPTDGQAPPLPLRERRWCPLHTSRGRSTGSRAERNWRPSVDTGRPAPCPRGPRRVGLKGASVVGHDVRGATGWPGRRCARPALRPCGRAVAEPRPASSSPAERGRASTGRAAVRMANSSARAADPSCLRRALMNALAWETGSAAWCLGFATLFRAGSCVSRWPRQRAGFRRSRSARLSAQARISSIRPRIRDAVSVFVRQIGWPAPRGRWPFRCPPRRAGRSSGTRRAPASCSTAKRAWHSSSPLHVQRYRQPGLRKGDLLLLCRAKCALRRAPLGHRVLALLDRLTLVPCKFRRAQE